MACWTLGVILYILVSGTPPFSEDWQCGLGLREQTNYRFCPQLFNSISASAKILISRLLKASTEERTLVVETLQQP